MHLVESARFNRGKDKTYFGVPGNLVAFACKVSKERGYEGFVAFDSKTVLVKHYQEPLGAIQLRGQRMYLDDIAAQKLIYQYFKAQNMGLIKEPKNVDLTIQSKPWNEEELAELSTIIQKAKKAKKQEPREKVLADQKSYPNNTFDLAAIVPFWYL